MTKTLRLLSAVLLLAGSFLAHGAARRAGEADLVHVVGIDG
jgi:hypothetical protein